VEIIRREAGQHFDPDLVEVFLRLEGAFRQIAVLYSQERSSVRVPPSTGISLVDQLSQEPELAEAGMAVPGSWSDGAGTPTLT
jgi:hypothetical protein